MACSRTWIGRGAGIARVLVAQVESIARAGSVAELALQSSVTAHGVYELGYWTQAFRHPRKVRLAAW